MSRIIRSEVKDPRIHPMTSVLRVTVAPDLKTCKAYISVLGDDEARKNTILGLKAAEGFIRRELAHSLNLRYTPEIRFVTDDSIEYGVLMSKRIDEVIRADQEASLSTEAELPDESDEQTVPAEEQP